MNKSQNTKNEQQKDLCVTSEQQVWKYPLSRALELQAENQKLKELLEECSPYIAHSAASRMIKNSAGHKKDMKLLTKIDEALR